MRVIVSLGQSEGEMPIVGTRSSQCGSILGKVLFVGEGVRERRKRRVRGNAFLEEKGEKWREGVGEEGRISSGELGLLPFSTERMIHPLWVNGCVGSHENLMVGGEEGRNNIKKENEEKTEEHFSQRKRRERNRQTTFSWVEVLPFGTFRKRFHCG